MQIRGLGHDVEWADAAGLATRSVHGMLAVSDPAGNRVELFHGITRDRKFVSPADVSSFVTGRLGMGHVVLLVPDIQKARACYCDLPGPKGHVVGEPEAPQRVTFGRHANDRVAHPGDEAGA